MKYSLILLIVIVQVSSCGCNKENLVALELDKTEIGMEIGDTEVIKVTQAPATNDTLVWASDNKTVATVFFGTVTAISSGTATITATFGDKVAECVVTVAEKTYQLVWSDEFDGTTLNTDNWTYETGTGQWGWGNNEEQYYTSRTENIRVEDGMLVIEARKEEYQGSSYTSARIKTKGKQEFTYGKIEVRLKVPIGVGTWSAFWTLATEGGWPECGEIDIMEHVGKEPKNIHCALHTLNKNGMNGLNPKGTQTLDEDIGAEFHVVTCEWIENEFMGFDRIHIYIDGVKTKTFAETTQLQDSGDWPYFKPHYFIINLAMGGNWGGDIDDSMFDNPVLYQLDYVRLYQYQ
jgi:beta-glucanase (GH16 family)